MQARMHALRHCVGREDGSERNAGSQWLRHRYYIGQDPVMLISEILSRPPKSALYLVNEKQRARLLRQSTRRGKELWSDGGDAAFTLNRLDADGADGVIKVALQRFHVVKADESYSRHQ